MAREGRVRPYPVSLCFCAAVRSAVPPGTEKNERVRPSTQRIRCVKCGRASELRGEFL